jgi:hypothetical protein
MANKQLDRDWEEFLTPEILRIRLISAALYLAAFEILKDNITGQIRSFFTFGSEEYGDPIDPKYEEDVLSRNRSRLYASLSWLVENAAIDQDDIGIFEQLKDCRNQIAHDMTKCVSTGSELKHITLFPVLIALLNKIEKWWIMNVEIPTDPDFDGVEIDEAEIIPGSIMMVRIMFDIALGSDVEAGAYLKAFRKYRKA